MTMQAMTALLPEESAQIDGRILFRTAEGNYQNLLDLPYRDRHTFVAEHVAVIFQDSINALNPNERILKQWSETVWLHRPDLSQKDLEEHILKRMDIFGVRGGRKTLHYFPDQLSGGMRQRIAIAMTLESPAKILIADEPTGNLDPDTAWEIMQLLNQINQLGTTIVMVTHAKDIVDKMEKRVIAIEKGRIVRDETGMYGYKEALEDATSAFDTMPMNSRGTFKAGFRRGGRS